MRRMIIVFGATFGISLAVGASFLLADDEARGQTTVSVDVGDRYFCNSSFMGGICETNISVGDTVTWAWVVASIHTVTSCDTGFVNCTPAGEFYSNILGNGATFSHTFNAAGSFDYRCDLHSTEMRGRVVVAAAQATPTASASPAAPAQSGAAGPIVSGAPTVSQTGAAVAIPSGGGAPAEGGPSWPLVVAIAGGVLLIASAGAGIALRRGR